MPSNLSPFLHPISAAHGVLPAPLELHHNGIKIHQTMVSQCLVRFFPSLVFPSFSIFFSSSSSFLFFFHIYRSMSIILCFSIDSMQLWDYKSVLHSIFRFSCLLWFTSFTSFPLYFSTIFFLPLCFLSFLFGDSFFFSISTVQVVFYVLFMLSFTCFFNFPLFTFIFCTCLSEIVPNSTPKRNEASCYACGCLSQLSSLF